MKYATLAGLSCWCPIYIALILLSLPLPLWASFPLQSSPQRQITGKVTDGNGEPLGGVNIIIPGKGRGTISDFDGTYTIQATPQDTLTFSYVGFKKVEIPVSRQEILNVQMEEDVVALDEVVLNTGYQQLPKERINGSFVVLDSALIQRSVATDVLSRLNGTVSGLLYSGGSPEIVTHNPNGRNPGILIRGISTIDQNVSRSPLIVLDNFPYEGELSNINPHDIESITVLKDAAAASIWGARSGNGVIVITTKKGRKKEAMQLDFSVNFGTEQKPDLWYDRNYLSAGDYIDIETHLFDQGYFNSYLQNSVSYPVVTPAVEILNDLKQGHISKQQAEQSLGVLRHRDVRNDYDKHIYQTALNQQYHIGLKGGAEKMTYSFSVGYDKNRHNLKRNGYQRLTLRALNTFNPVKNLEITFGVNYSNNRTDRNNQLNFGSGIQIGGFTHSGIYPYAQFAGPDGTHLSIARDYRTGFKEEMQQAGFKYWQYRPLDELYFRENSSKINDLLIKGSLKYRIAPFLNAEVLYQNERQKISNYEYFSNDAYYTRNLINRFSILNDGGSITYQVPENGGVLNVGEYDWNSHNFRGQLSFDSTYGDLHTVTTIVGTEVRELKTQGFQRTSYGYEKQFGTASTALDYSTFLPTTPSGSARIPAPDGAVLGRLNRFVSLYANVGYIYDNRLSVTLSGRNDGTNLFGVNINQKITPLWSAGAGWVISNENFFRSPALDYLKLRLTYGYNGNVYYGSAYTTGVYRSSYLTGLPAISNLTAPNPDLRWEKVKNINLGIDFRTAKNVLSGTFELYQKTGEDLVEPYPLAHNTGFRESMINSASTKTRGIDLTLNSKNINRSFKWNTTLILSTVKDEVTRYEGEVARSSIQTRMIVEGRPLNSVFSYKWMGLDPENGDPLGFLNEAVSKDYEGIINNFEADSLVFNGSSMPQFHGAIRNDFSYKDFSLSVNVLFKGGYVFRRASTSLNYPDLIDGYANSDYVRRWQKPGDEKNTNVPSIVYPANSRRNTFYNYSEVLVEKGDHIRLQDIRVAYNLKSGLGAWLPFRSCSIYTYLSNIGILWRANDLGIDPDKAPNIPLLHTLPNPFSMSFGISASF
ncbi:SusC/RagA family TonB-linked outer membrane protein [Sinomicrobium weinanense]|uniref:SusC/RagA family TonB-linked outer membrane protein n=1 Tax=Sinomicrobium weinanense TaxID=2842200 RepID=A0A926Q3C6_9FLAO|nr:SusC/RagA family TonB-linked outer membrane protein [Sinomicrobium weinanense]MBC9795866.1 SusC/RagA family TonB-linked outer membrane protein [Sinomicrobium weinanense]MBU3125386.1 SusC/RagA family TonB-linked outer membrane protein [Sinomicrobium weinanense]